MPVKASEYYKEKRIHWRMERTSINLDTQKRNEMGDILPKFFLSLKDRQMNK